MAGRRAVVTGAAGGIGAALAAELIDRGADVVLADLSPALERGIEARVPSIVPGRDRLDRLAQGIRSGRYPLEVSEVLPLAQIAEAHRRLEEGHTRGKLVLDVRA